MKNKNFIFIITLFFLISLASARDVSIWQGQYYTGDVFNQGTYVFNFTVFDDIISGTSCFSKVETITTGHWGQWKTEVTGVSSSCNDTSKDYYVNINIAGVDQSPRRLLTHWNYLRKNIDEITTGKLNSTEIAADTQITTPLINTQNIIGINVTADIGLFNYLGSIGSRISRISVQDIDFSGNINGIGNIFTTGKIQGNFYSSDNSQGITNITGYKLCAKTAGLSCQTWCTVQIKNGLITGCI